MENDNPNAQPEYQAPEPNPDLKSLDKLVGTWKISGGAQGQVTYQWMEGGFFLIQHVDLEQDGQKIKGIEIIGHEQKFGAEPGKDIQSRFYDNMGNTLDYVYELDGDVITIWGGEKGSPILASRLARLVKSGILRKTPDSDDKRKDIYTLTRKGLDLYPVILEMILWSAKYDPDTPVSKEFAHQARKESEQIGKEKIKTLYLHSNLV